MINSIRRLGDVNNQKRDQPGKNKKAKKNDEFKKNFAEMLDDSTRGSSKK